MMLPVIDPDQAELRPRHGKGPCETEVEVRYRYCAPSFFAFFDSYSFISAISWPCSSFVFSAIFLASSIVAEDDVGHVDGALMVGDHPLLIIYSAKRSSGSSPVAAALASAAAAGGASSTVAFERS
jgi:hypothetical protein